MRRSTWSVGAYLFLVFSSGIAVGGFGHYLYTVKSVSATTRKSPDEQRKRYVDELRTRLKLTSEQVTELNEIMDTTHEQFRVLREKHKPEMKAIREEQVDKIRGILEKSQREDYEAWRKERDEKAAASSGPGC